MKQELNIPAGIVSTEPAILKARFINSDIKNAIRKALAIQSNTERREAGLMAPAINLLDRPAPQPQTRITT